MEEAYTKKHTNIGNNNLPAQFDDQSQVGTMDIDPDEMDRDPGENDLGESQDQMKRSSWTFSLCSNLLVGY
jgi:hypothetical protein